MAYLPHALFALFLWWFSTGLVLYLNGLPKESFRRSLIGTTLVTVLAVFGLAWSSSRESILAVYVGFSSGLIIYAWLELTYYMGFVTGPRKHSCEPGCAGWRHFGHALQANLYHEAATIAGAGVVFLLSSGGDNRIGLWTFLLLWGMQLSAKLNVFLGVRNLSEEFLPAHMEHLKSFLKKKPMNLLFPFSIVAGTVLTMWLVEQYLAAEPDSMSAVSFGFLSSLSALAVLEHWFLVLPLPATALWQWWLDRRDADNKKPDGSAMVLPLAGAGITRPVAATPEGSEELDDNVFPLRRRNL